MAESWMKHKEGWTRRINAFYRSMTEGVEADNLKFADDEEREWYIKAKKDLDEENARIAERCKKKGIKPFRVCYDPVELEW